MLHVSHHCCVIQLHEMYKHFLSTYVESTGLSTYFPITHVSHLQACNAAGINCTFSFCRPCSIATRFSPEEVVFLPAALAKQSRQGKPLGQILFLFFSTQFRGLVAYRYSSSVRPLRLRDVTKLFISLVKLH